MSIESLRTKLCEVFIDGDVELFLAVLGIPGIWEETFRRFWESFSQNHDMQQKNAKSRAS